MKNQAVFTFQSFPWDSAAEEDEGKDIVLWTPTLGLYSSAIVAARSEEGLNFVEGDIKFFTADGLPLVPDFSQEPYIDHDKNTYFAGVYKLIPTTGENLVAELYKRIETNATPNARIKITLPTTDEGAVLWGWPSLDAMKSAFTYALEILPLDLAVRVDVPE